MWSFALCSVHACMSFAGTINYCLQSAVILMDFNTFQYAEARVYSRAHHHRGVGGQKHYFLRFTKKFRSILKIFLGTFLVIKAVRFADDFASGQ